MAIRDTFRRLGVAVRRGPAREELDARRRIRTADDVARVVAGMRGLVTKLAQMASYVDPSLSSELRAALSQFQADAPSMDAELALHTLAAELGERVELIASIDDTPVASASIGQVHRAELRDGTPIAIKIQFPDAAELIDRDLADTPSLLRLLRVAFPQLSTESIARELAERIREELDYRHEAAVQAIFARAYSGHPRILVPRPIRALTTRRVLTSEWVEGLPFASAAIRSDDDRSAIGEVLFRFVFRSLYRLRRYHGDPHPGNYLILPGPRVAFVDFGFSRRFSAAELETFEALVRARVVHPDRHAFATAVRRAGLVVRDDVDDETVWRFFSPYYEILEKPGQWRVTREWASALVRHTFDASNPISPSLNVPPAFVVVQRINLGLYALLAELEACRPWRAIAEDIWPFVAAEPVTEIGREEVAWQNARGI